MIAQLFYIFATIIGLLGSVVSVIIYHKFKFSILIAFGSAILASSFACLSALLVLIQGSFTFTLFPTTFGSFGFTVDKLGAFFLITVSMLTIPVSIYSIGYVTEYVKDYNIGLMGFLYNAFYLSMIWVVAANNAIFFLIVWELMSLVSYLLVVYENKQAEKVTAGNIYVIMTHFGTGFILIAFFTMGFMLGSFDFATFSLLGLSLPTITRNVVFILLLIGFGTKAGIMPMHVWLPYAHPAAPSNISSLMSGVMIKTAILMLIRTCFSYLGIASRWWGWVLLVLGTISAVLGIMYATVERDIKQILAFSSVENIGLIFIGLGTSVLFFNLGYIEFASLAIIATLYHTINHSMFKGLLFMGAGSILYATHTKNIENLGGLIKKMPQTSVFFFIAVLSITAIPPLNGFISEWLLMQSLLLSFDINNIAIKIILPLVVGAIALTGGLAIVCFVRLFGITFLAVPRTKYAEEAKEVPRTMRFGMAIVAILCIIMGVFSTLILSVIDSISKTITGISVVDSITNGFVIFPIIPQFVSVSPYLITILLVLFIPLLFYLFNRIKSKQKIEIGDSWDCGTPLTPRNEYTGTAFAQPINRVFGGIYRPNIQVKTLPSSSPYIYKEKGLVATEREPIFENFLYRPIVKSVKIISMRVRKLQNGKIMAYLGYIFVTLILVLIILGWK